MNEEHSARHTGHRTAAPASFGSPPTPRIEAIITSVHAAHMHRCPHGTAATMRCRSRQMTHSSLGDVAATSVPYDATGVLLVVLIAAALATLSGEGTKDTVNVPPRQPRERASAGASNASSCESERLRGGGRCHRDEPNTRAAPDRVPSQRLWSTTIYPSCRSAAHTTNTDTEDASVAPAMSHLSVLRHFSTCPDTVPKKANIPSDECRPMTAPPSWRDRLPTNVSRFPVGMMSCF